MKIKGLVIAPGLDNVAVVTENTAAGDTVAYNTNGQFMEITAIEDIPVYHKISLTRLKQGDAVYKYGEIIGRVTEAVEPGGYIHVHNMEMTEGNK